MRFEPLFQSGSLGNILNNQQSIRTTLILTMLYCLFFIMINNVGLGSAAAVKSCIKSGQCECETDAGEYVNLNLLNKKTFSAVALTQDTFTWNPCQPFSCANAQSTACQHQNGGAYFDIGSLSSETFDVDPTKGLYVKYTATDRQRFSKVFLVCDATATTPTFSTDGEKLTSNYEMTIKAKEVCPTSGGGGGGGDESYVGTILVVIFFVLLIIYFVAGVVFQAFYRKQTGVEIVPNHTFWLGLPGLIKDGFFFVFGRFCGRRQGYEENI